MGCHKGPSDKQHMLEHVRQAGVMMYVCMYICAYSQTLYIVIPFLHHLLSSHLSAQLDKWLFSEREGNYYIFLGRKTKVTEGNCNRKGRDYRRKKME